MAAFINSQNACRQRYMRQRDTPKSLFEKARMQSNKLCCRSIKHTITCGVVQSNTKIVSCMRRGACIMGSYCYKHVLVSFGLDKNDTDKTTDVYTDRRQTKIVSRVNGVIRNACRQRYSTKRPFKLEMILSRAKKYDQTH